MEGALAETTLLDRAFTRAAGAPLVHGNSVRLLKDSSENYPAWLAAIHGAQHRILFENYFICDDEVGAEFADALAARARDGVIVRLIHDWLGSLNRSSSSFWRALRASGVEVRSFNPLRLTRPLDVLHRDHRKLLAVDGRVAFVTGLCVGREWAGDAARGIAPWRDTGIEVRGPALCDIERAFAQVWATIGPAIPDEDLTARESVAPTGEVALRIVANAPGMSSIFRLDQLIAASARRTLWLTDAYFAGVSPYVQALRAAARDGVDVRLLVPGSSDIPFLRPLSQGGYRPLLETGVRVFEWKGTMMHAKTAVADGRWARVGSSNLNLASWISNYELDAVVEDERFANEMEAMHQADLENATEIVLRSRRRGVLHRFREGEERRAQNPVLRGSPGSGSASRAAAGALRLGRTVSAALTEQRVIEPTDARLVGIVGALLLTLAIVAVIWPVVLALPLILICAWMGIALLARARTLRRMRRSRGLPVTRVTRVDRDSAPP